MTDPPRFRIDPLVTGYLDVPTPLMHWRTGWGETTRVAAIAWLLRSERHTVLVDAGVGGVQEISEIADGSWREEGVIWEGPGLVAALAGHGLEPRSVDLAIFTHLHFDHFGNAPLLERARLMVSGRGYRWASLRTRSIAARYPYDVLGWVERNAADRLEQAADRVTPLPGLEVRWVGGHTPCSQAVRALTDHGPVILAGDVFPTMENVQQDVPTGNYHDSAELLEAMRTVREWGGAILPSHDPRVAESWPRALASESSA